MITKAYCMKMERRLMNIPEVYKNTVLLSCNLQCDKQNPHAYCHTSYVVRRTLNERDAFL